MELSRLKRHTRWAILFSLLCLGQHCYAQFSSNVQGTITDPSGAIVPGATIKLTNTSTGNVTTVTSSALGLYRFDSISPGDYEISVEANGFRKSMTRRHISTDETAGLNIALSVDQSQTTVEVTEDQEHLNPDETRLQYTLEAKDLSRLPLPDRSTLTALRTAPGVVGTIETSGSTNTNLAIGQAAPDARANGRPAGSNLYLLDRIPISSTETAGQLNIVPNPDMLSEIALQTTTFSVENGATSSLQVDFTSKSGTKQFHGDLDGTYTSKPFEASPNFGAVTPFHRKYLMGSLGGPIPKAGAFFFGSFEHVDNSSSSTGTGTGWTGDFYQWAKNAFPNSPIATGLFSHLPTGLTKTSVNHYARDFFPANNPGTPGKAACGQASSYFLPCETPLDISGEFNQSPTITGNQYNIRLDRAFAPENDRAYVSFFRVDQKSEYLDPRPDFSGKTPSSSWYVGAGYTHIFNANLVNQINAGVNRYWAGNEANPLYAIFPHSTLYCFTCNGFAFFGGPTTSPDSPFFGSANKEHIYAVRDYVNWVKGRHSIRLGFQFQHIDYWQDQAQNFSRPENTYFSDIFEMLQGLADETSLYTISATTGKWQGQYYGAQENQYGAYLQDEWKVKANLLLSFGLRWDDFGNPSNYGHLAAPYSQLVLGSGPTLQERMSGARLEKVQNVFSSDQAANVLPRVGISWAPKSAHAMTLHGGVGLYSDFIGLNGITSGLSVSSPSRLSLTLHDSAEPSNNLFGFFNPSTPWHPYTGVSGVAGLPDAKAFVGTQGITPPYGIPYPEFTLTGFTSRGLATGTNGYVYPSGARGVDPNLKPQHALLWNLGISEEVSHGIVLGLLYSGSHGYDQFLSSSKFGSPPGSNGNSVLWTQVSKIAWTTNALRSNYNALIATAQQRAGRLNWQGSYTWSHTLDNSHAANPYTIDGFYANSDLDVRNRFTFSSSYDLPSLRSGALRVITGGWVASGIAIAQSGTPFTVFTANDLNQDGGKDRVNGSQDDIPDFHPGLTPLGGFNRRQYKQGVFPVGCAQFGGVANGCPFNDSPASLDPRTLEGNEPINAFLNPGYFVMDISLQKRNQLAWISEKSTLIFRVEALNALNRANLGQIGSGVEVAGNNDEGSSQFGKSTSANNPRIIQLGARLEF